MLLQWKNRTLTYFMAFFQVIKDLLKGLFEMVFEDAVHQIKEPCSIFVINQSVVVDTEDLVNKQPNHSMFVFQRLLLQQQAASNDAGEIS